MSGHIWFEAKTNWLVVVGVSNDVRCSGGSTVVEARCVDLDDLWVLSQVHHGYWLKLQVFLLVSGTGVLKDGLLSLGALLDRKSTRLNSSHQI